MKKKIIFFCPSIEEGGVEKNLFLMVNKFSEKFKTTIVTANYNKKIMFDKKVKFISTNKNDIGNLPRIIKSIFFSLLLIKIYFKDRNNILISYESNIFAIILAKIFNIKVIVRSNASPVGYIKNSLKKEIFKLFFNLADVVLVNSSEFKNQIDKILNIKSKILNNSIIEKNQLIKLSKKSINFKSSSKNLYKLVMIGRLVEQKDHATAIKALNLIKNKINFQVFIIGKGGLKNNLKNLCKKKKLQKKIKFIGYKKNIYPYLRWADALILSSKYEGCPNVLMEAISMNKITISSDCPTGPREILKNGKAGYLFKTSNYKDLANKIEKSFFNKKLSQNKINYAKKTIDRFSIQNNFLILSRIINSLK